MNIACFLVVLAFCCGRTETLKKIQRLVTDEVRHIVKSRAPLYLAECSQSVDGAIAAGSTSFAI